MISSLSRCHSRKDYTLPVLYTKICQQVFEEAEIMPDFHLLFPKICIGVPAATHYIRLFLVARWKGERLQNLRTWTECHPLRID